VRIPEAGSLRILRRGASRIKASACRRVRNCALVLPNRDDVRAGKWMLRAAFVM
jgi:hypothetical protein